MTKEENKEELIEFRKKLKKARREEISWACGALVSGYLTYLSVAAMRLGNHKLSEWVILGVGTVVMTGVTGISAAASLGNHFIVSNKKVKINEIESRLKNKEELIELRKELKVYQLTRTVTGLCTVELGALSYSAINEIIKGNLKLPNNIALGVMAGMFSSFALITGITFVYSNVFVKRQKLKIKELTE